MEQPMSVTPSLAQSEEAASTRTREFRIAGVAAPLTDFGCTVEARDKVGRDLVLCHVRRRSEVGHFERRLGLIHLHMESHLAVCLNHAEP